jgi:hypothetical protein
MLIIIWSHLQETLDQLENHLSELDLKFIGVNIYDADALPNKMTAVDFLESLTFCLHEKYKKEVIVLIDEYNTLDLQKKKSQPSSRAINDKQNQ